MAVLTCEEGQVYVAVTKKCKSYGSEESYQILSGSTTLITSQPFASNEQRTDEYCLAAANNNNQYTFRMKDTYGSSGDSWTAGAWVSVAGIYGNIFFKNFMTERVTEDVALSLYYPIMKGETWRMLSSSSSIASDWTAVAFADASWQEVSSNTTTVSGSQYFRKHFASIANMAAYELQLNYRYGIVAYVNGVEVFRDHMPEGAMTPATLSDGAFDAYGFYGTIRPAGEIEGADSVLAVSCTSPRRESTRWSSTRIWHCWPPPRPAPSRPPASSTRTLSRSPPPPARVPRRYSTTTRRATTQPPPPHCPPP